MLPTRFFYFTAMPTKYRVFNDTIEEVEVLGETPTMVTLKNPTYTGRICRERKESDSIFWADTWEEAHGWILNKVHSDIAYAQARYEYQLERLAKIEQMQKPTE